MGDPVAEAELANRVADFLEQNSGRPFCYHGLYEELLAPLARGDRDTLLDATRAAADRAVQNGRARREYVSATAIGVHCEDSMYWSVRSACTRLEQFGPEYESPTILARLGSHIRCHGL